MTRWVAQDSFATGTVRPERRPKAGVEGPTHKPFALSAGRSPESKGHPSPQLDKRPHPTRIARPAVHASARTRMAM